MRLCPRVPDKARLLSHPSITIHRYRLCATVSPAEKKFESELRGWRDHRPQTTDHRPTANHRRLRASDRDLGEPVADPGPRRGYPPSLQACYSPANESVAVARRPFHAHTTYGSIGSVGKRTTTTSTTTGRCGHGRASVGLERHPGESKRNERNCGTTVPNHGAQRDTLRAEFGRPNSVCLTRCPPGSGSS